MSDWKNRVPVSMQKGNEMSDNALARVAKNKTLYKTVRNIGVIEGGLTLLFLSSGFAFVFPLIFMIVCLTAVTGIKTYNRHELKAASHDIADDVKREALEERAVAMLNSQDAGRVKTPESIYECPNYDAVTFEQKLLSEGVIKYKDMSLCEIFNCPLCSPLRNAMNAETKAEQEAERLAREREHENHMRDLTRKYDKAARERDSKRLAEMSDDDAQRVKDWFEDAKKFNLHDVEVDDLLNVAKIKNPAIYISKRTKCKGCGDGTWFINMCPLCRLEQLNQQAENDRLAKIAADKAAKVAAKAEKVRLFEERRHVVLNGLNLYRPDGVPEGAVPSLLHGREIDPLATHSFIVWKWTEDGDNIKFYKQPVVADAFSVMSDRQHGPVSSWYSVTDPKTGEYLGDYRTVNGKVELGHREELKNANGKVIKVEYHHSDKW